MLLDAEAYGFFLESLGHRSKPSQTSRAVAARYRRGQRKGVRSPLLIEPISKSQRYSNGEWLPCGTRPKLPVILG